MIMRRNNDQRIRNDNSTLMWGFCWHKETGGNGRKSMNHKEVAQFQDQGASKREENNHSISDHRYLPFACDELVDAEAIDPFRPVTTMDGMELLGTLVPSRGFFGRVAVPLAACP